MIVTVGEVLYFIDRISKMKFLAKSDPDLVTEMSHTLQDLKDSFKEAGESYEDFAEDEVEIPMERVANLVEEILDKKIGL